jgi:hypothetical protein
VRGDVEPACAVRRLDAVGVWHLGGGERCLACADPEVRISGTDAQLPFEHVEELVLRPVDVERRRVSVRRERLECQGADDLIAGDYWNAEPGFITMNLPLLLDTLERAGIENPTVCASINKIGFRMSGGIKRYEEVISQKRCKLVAMQVLAAGAIRPDEAFEYVCTLEGVDSILFGASSRANIRHSKQLIENLYVPV